MLIYRLVAGETYCGIAALSLLKRLPPVDGDSVDLFSTAGPDQSFMQDVLSWLVHRQTTTLIEDEHTFEVFNRTPPNEEEIPRLPHENPIVYHRSVHSEHGAPISQIGAPISELEVTPNISGHPPPPHGVSVYYPSPPLPTTAPLAPEPGDLLCIGFNGRCNKFADTCYCFWAGGTLGVRAYSTLLSPRNLKD